MIVLHWQFLQLFAKMLLLSENFLISNKIIIQLKKLTMNLDDEKEIYRNIYLQFKNGSLYFHMKTLLMF